MKSIHLENSNPIKNPANKINLMYVDDIIERLAKSASDNKSKSSLFIDTKSVSLVSIYDFLLNYKKNKIIEEDILKFYDMITTIFLLKLIMKTLTLKIFLMA